MRIPLALALFVVSCSAQAQTSFDPGDILNRMGDPWSEVKTDIPPPDSGRVVGKSGDLVWYAPDPEVTRMEVAVRNGVLSQFVATTSENGRHEFEEVSQMFERGVGAPERDGFYSSEQVRALGAPSDPPLEIMIDAANGVMVVRLAEDG